jgi:hypothetical protein
LFINRKFKLTASVRAKSAAMSALTYNLNLFYSTVHKLISILNKQEDVTIAFGKHLAVGLIDVLMWHRALDKRDLVGSHASNDDTDLWC